MQIYMVTDCIPHERGWMTEGCTSQNLSILTHIPNIGPFKLVNSKGSLLNAYSEHGSEVWGARREHHLVGAVLVAITGHSHVHKVLLITQRLESSYQLHRIVVPFEGVVLLRRRLSAAHSHGCWWCAREAGREGSSVQHRRGGCDGVGSVGV